MIDLKKISTTLMGTALIFSAVAYADDNICLRDVNDYNSLPSSKKITCENAPPIEIASLSVQTNKPDQSKICKSVCKLIPAPSSSKKSLKTSPVTYVCLWTANQLSSGIQCIPNSVSSNKPKK